MSLHEGGSDYRPPDISLHPSSTKGKTPKGYISTWNLANKQHELITKHIKSFMKFTNSIDYSDEGVTTKC